VATQHPLPYHIGLFNSSLPFAHNERTANKHSRPQFARKRVFPLEKASPGHLSRANETKTCNANDNRPGHQIVPHPRVGLASRNRSTLRFVKRGLCAKRERLFPRRSPRRSYAVGHRARARSIARFDRHASETDVPPPPTSPRHRSLSSPDGRREYSAIFRPRGRMLQGMSEWTRWSPLSARDPFIFLRFPTFQLPRQLSPLILKPAHSPRARAVSRRVARDFRPRARSRAATVEAKTRAAVEGDGGRGLEGPRRGRVGGRAFDSFFILIF